MESVLIALFLIVLAAAASWFVAQPLFEKSWALADEVRTRHAEFVWEKNILLQNLKDLEMDFRMNKVAEGDYRAHRQELLAQVADRISRVEAVEREALSRQIELEVAKRYRSAEFGARSSE